MRLRLYIMIELFIFFKDCFRFVTLGFFDEINYHEGKLPKHTMDIFTVFSVVLFMKSIFLILQTVYITDNFSNWIKFRFFVVLRYGILLLSF